MPAPGSSTSPAARHDVLWHLSWATTRPAAGPTTSAAASCLARYQYVGYFRHGTFTQSGGTNTPISRSTSAYNSTGSGTYSLSAAGQLSAGDRIRRPDPARASSLSRAGTIPSRSPCISATTPAATGPTTWRDRASCRPRRRIRRRTTRRHGRLPADRRHQRGQLPHHRQRRPLSS